MMNGPGLLATDFLDKPLALDKLEYPKMPSPSGDVISGMPSLTLPDGRSSPNDAPASQSQSRAPPQNAVGTVLLHGVPIVSLVIDGKERLCLAQISNTLLKDFSYNEIHNRRVALGITCVQCTPVQLEILRRAGAMPISSRRCGMITKREAERLVKSFLEESLPPQLPENFAFRVSHACGWGCQGNFMPARYNSSRAKCIKCSVCELFFSPNKFIFHFHRTATSKYHHPDAANFNSWRRHLYLDYDGPNEDLEHAWEDVKAMFNGGSRKRLVSPSSHESSASSREEIKRSRSDPGEPSPGLTKLSGLGLSYPYPVLPMASPACSNVAGYLTRPPHPAFPFPTMDSGALGENKGPNNLADLWKAKAVNPYVNPFGLLWAKNFGLYNDPNASYRQVMDLTQHGPMGNRLCGSSSRSITEGTKISSRDNNNLNKEEFWQMPKDIPSHADNYYSAFKPVGREHPLGFEPSSLRLSPEREGDMERSWSERGSLLDDERQWPDRPHSLGSEGSPVSEGGHSFQEPEAEPEAEDINVTDVDQSDAGERELSKPSLRPHDVRRLLDTGSRDSDQSTEAPAVEEALTGKDLCQQSTSESTGDDIFKGKGPYSLSKDELQSQLERLIEERSRAEKDYEQLKDSFQLKCASDPSYKEEMEREFAIVKDAHDALRQFSNKMVALRNCLDLIKPVQ